MTNVAVQGINFATREKADRAAHGKIQQGCSLPQLRRDLSFLRHLLLASRLLPLDLLVFLLRLVLLGGAREAA